MPRETKPSAEKPHLLFALVKLAELGAVKEHINIPTVQLGRYIGISQQSASRNIKLMERTGVINRYMTREGQYVKITEKGVEYLSRMYAPLAKIFEKPVPLTITGQLFTGMGDGQYYMKIYQPHFKAKLGFTPYPGTLNLKISTADGLKTMQKIRAMPGIEIEEFTNKGRIFGGVKCFRAKIAGKIDGALIVPYRTHYGHDVAELIAPEKIKQKLNLKEGDSVKVEVFF